MGHRAYVAYEQQNGTFSVHYSHWGAHGFALCDRITESSPLGGPNDLEPEFLTAFTDMLDGMTDEMDAELSGRIVEKQEEKCVEPTPIEQFIQFDEVVELIGDKSGIETLYVVEQDYTVYGYRVESLRIADENHGNVLIRPRDKQGETDEPYSAKYERGFVAGIRKQLTNLVEKDILSVTEAKEEAIESIVNWAAGRSGLILAHSTAIPNEVLTNNPRAFLDTAGGHRYFGEMIPTSYGDINSWAIPDELDIPPAFRTIEDEVLTETIDENEETEASQVELTELGDDGDENVSVLPDPDEEGDEIPDVNVDPDSSDFDRNNVAFTVDGEPFSIHDIPMELRDKLNEYREFSRAVSLNLTNIYECDECRDRSDGFEYGFLTDSENTDSYKNQYTCSRSWRKFRAPHTMHVGGEHAPETWVVHTEVKSDVEPVTVDEVGQDTTYVVTISQMESFTGDEEDRIDYSTVEISPPDDVELPDSGTIESTYPSKTVNGKTNENEWELTAWFGSSTVKLSWERVNEDGVVEYKYREVDGNQTSKEYIGKTPVAVDDNENVVTDRLKSEATSRTWERECGSTDFSQVWPPSDLQRRNVSVPDVTADEVPNSAGHLSRIQSGLKSPVSKGEIEYLIGRAAYQLRKTYNVYDESSTQKPVPVDTESNTTESTADT